jgi:lipopolysaccharide/colanic/teichoic acid biosynthesis glycosyltransferase
MYALIKRSLDIVGAAVLLLVFSPLIAAITASVRLDSDGPVFYGGWRVGRGGRPFRMWKFRTMVSNADRIGGPSTAGDDPRITRVGKHLRRYKLDELPQLWNVLVGNMSLVGPRPEVQQYVDLYTAEERAILTVRPGITDFASLWNSDEGALLQGAEDPERVYLEQIRPTKIRLQLEYVRRQSVATDLLILGQTAAAVLLRRKAPALESGGGFLETHRSGVKR